MFRGSLALFFIFTALTPCAHADVAGESTPRSCWREPQSSAQTPSVLCSDGVVWTYSNPTLFTQVGDVADVYCSYAYRGESKPELRARLLAEDLLRRALGAAPRCYAGAVRQAHAPRATAPDTAPATPIPLGAPPAVPARKPRPRGTFTPRIQDPEVRARELTTQRRRLGLKTEGAVAPNELIRAIAQSTRASLTTPFAPSQRTLRLCIALDTSDSMRRHALFVAQQFAELEKAWRDEYASVSVSLIEFGQLRSDRLELRTLFTDRDPQRLREALEHFQTFGDKEPKLDAAAACVKTFSSSMPPEGEERVILVLSDEPGNAFPPITPTPEELHARITARFARYEEINPLTYERENKRIAFDQTLMFLHHVIADGGIDASGVPQLGMELIAGGVRFPTFRVSGTFQELKLSNGEEKALLPAMTQISRDGRIVLLHGFQSQPFLARQLIETRVYDIQSGRILARAWQSRHDDAHVWLTPDGLSLVITENGNRFEQILLPTSGKELDLGTFSPAPPRTTWRVHFLAPGDRIAARTAGRRLVAFEDTVPGPQRFPLRESQTLAESIDLSELSADRRSLSAFEFSQERVRLFVPWRDGLSWTESQIPWLSTRAVGENLLWLASHPESGHVITRHRPQTLYFWHYDRPSPTKPGAGWIPIRIDSRFRATSVRWRDRRGFRFDLYDAQGQHAAYDLEPLLKSN